MEQRVYGLAVTTGLGVEEAERAVREALAAQGFGVLTEIDVAATLRAKIGVERAPYKILGACNPQLAHRGLSAEEDLGLLLPCNVIVYARGDQTVVEAFDPLIMLNLIANPELEPIAREARERLERALAALEPSAAAIG